MSETPRARLGRLRLADLKAAPPAVLTLREHLEAIRDNPFGREDCLCGDCTVERHVKHAVAALAILDASDECYGNEKTSPHPYWRLVWDADGIVPDPEKPDA